MKLYLLTERKHSKYLKLLFQTVKFKQKEWAYTFFHRAPTCKHTHTCTDFYFSLLCLYPEVISIKSKKSINGSRKYQFKDF